MKRFMYFSVSVLCLAIAALIGFYIGSHQVEAQAPGQIEHWQIIRDGSYTYYYAVLPHGDVYLQKDYNFAGEVFNASAQFLGNMFTGPVSTEQNSWGEIKGQFNK